MAAPTLNTLWIGPALGAVERACLRSALRQGHPVRLWCYQPPTGVPDGVELAEAASVVAESRIIRHANGSPALFSNLFRYELQRQGLGTWIDADLYLLRPLEVAGSYLFGREEGGTINTAALRLPPDSPLIEPLTAIFDEDRVPFWLPLRHRLAAEWRLRRTGRSGLSEMPWGTAGPKALTALARRHGLDGLALPESALHPVGWRQAGWICDPAVALEDVAGPETIAVHLWNDRIGEWKDQPAPPGSFLARLQEEGR